MSYLSTCQGARTTAEPGIVLVPTIPLNRITVLGALDKEKRLSRTVPGLHNELAVGKVGVVLALLLHLIQLYWKGNYLNYLQLYPYKVYHLLEIILVEIYVKIMKAQHFHKDIT